MGEFVGGTMIFGAEDAAPLLGVTALESVGMEGDWLNRRRKRQPSRTALYSTARRSAPKSIPHLHGGSGF